MARGFCITREITKYFIESSKYLACGGVHCIIIGNKTQFYSPSADNTIYPLYYNIYIVFNLRLNCISHEYKSSSGFQSARVNDGERERERKVNSFASRVERRKRRRQRNLLRNRRRKGKPKTCKAGKRRRRVLNEILRWQHNSCRRRIRDDHPAYYSSKIWLNLQDILCTMQRPTAIPIYIYCFKRPQIIIILYKMLSQRFLSLHQINTRTIGFKRNDERWEYYKLLINL